MNEKPTTSSSLDARWCRLRHARFNRGKSFGVLNEEVVFFVVVMWCTFVLEVLFLSLVSMCFFAIFV